MITLTDFPDTFSDYINSSLPTAKETSLVFDENDELCEITDYRNNSLHQHFLTLHKAYPVNKKMAWAAAKAFAEKYCPSLIKDGWKEVKSIFESASKSRIANENKQKEGIKKDLVFLDGKGILEYVTEPVKWLIKDFIPCGGIVGFCSDAGVGKTWIALCMVICIALGKRFLGIYDTVPGSVIYVNQDMYFSELQSRLIKLGLKIGLPIYSFVKRNFSVEEYGDELLELIAEVNPVLVVFDTFRGVHSKNENSSQEMEEIMRYFIKISDMGIAVLFLHHVTKNDPVYRGSTVIKGSVDLLLVLEKVKDKPGDFQITYDKVRIVEPIKPKKLRMISRDDSVSFVELLPDPNEKPENKPAGKVNRTTKQQAQDFIIEMLISSNVSGKNEVSKDEFTQSAEGKGLTPRKVEDELQELVKSGKIMNPKKGLYNLPDKGGST